ncbi:unnamed protein product [Leptidea sinapis]|uniref:Uncharacterized protein n=1 Tax=Leptidea sinapis TaxID=189913 RepID=A0A5E4PPW4_9NEOP|nr:unnamed protein product [Leptidea sinapis]
MSSNVTRLGLSSPAKNGCVRSVLFTSFSTKLFRSLYSLKRDSCFSVILFHCSFMVKYSSVLFFCSDFIFAINNNNQPDGDFTLKVHDFKLSKHNNCNCPQINKVDNFKSRSHTGSEVVLVPSPLATG